MLDGKNVSEPYADYAMAYVNSGLWPLPINRNSPTKPPFVAGCHGRDGRPVTAADVKVWSEPYAEGNLAIRLPQDIFGLDVDDYGSKHGGVTLAELEDSMGPLPATIRSTARPTSGKSGIKLFRIPKKYTGMDWPSYAGRDIEIIWYGNRYAVVYPSIHNELSIEYRYYDEDELDAEMDPDVAIYRIGARELPYLPVKWCEFYAKAHTVVTRVDVDAEEWLDEHLDGDPCEAIMAKNIEFWSAKLTSSPGTPGGQTGMHDTGAGAITSILRDAARGHPGGKVALSELRPLFLDGLSKRSEKRRREAAIEWRKLVFDMVPKAAGIQVFNSDWNGDPCEEPGLLALQGKGGVVVDPRDQMRENFWNARESLTLMRKWAQARMVSPMAALGEVLAEVVCNIPPCVQLPPIVGGRGTLNMLIALTGDSGSGKGGASGVVKDLIRCHGFMGTQRIPVGSGEGIPKAFGHMHYDKDTKKYDLVRTSWSSVIEVKEIDSLTAIQSRMGSTLTAQLCQFYSGEQLGYWYADIHKRVIIPDHSYRGCLVAGVQPGRGGVIINDTDNGFAQRWLWLPATDAHAPVNRPDEPKSVIEWKVPLDIPDDEPDRTEPYILDVCQKAIDAIITARRPALLGETDGLESHKLYTRLKVAAALAFLDDNIGVRDEDWDLAGYLMIVSDGVRGRVERELRYKESKAAFKAGQMDGIRADAAGESAHLATMKRIGDRVLRIMSESDDWVSYAKGIKNKIAARDRDMLPEAMNNLVEAGKLESKKVMVHGREGIQYRIL